MTLPADWLDVRLVDLPETPEVDSALLGVVLSISRGDARRGPRVQAHGRPGDQVELHCAPGTASPMRGGGGVVASWGGAR